MTIVSHCVSILIAFQVWKYASTMYNKLCSRIHIDIRMSVQPKAVRSEARSMQTTIKLLDSSSPIILLLNNRCRRNEIITWNYRIDMYVILTNKKCPVEKKNPFLHYYFFYFGVCFCWIRCAINFVFITSPLNTSVTTSPA